MLCDTIKYLTPILQQEDKFFAEFKYDGGRCIYDKGSFRGRENKKSHSTNYTKKIPELESHLTCILDGELIYENPTMERYDRYLVVMSRLRLASNFDIRIQSKISPLKFMVFDILELNGKDLRDLPLIERKEILKNLEFDNPNFRKIEFSTEIDRILFTAQEKRFEGIIIKEVDSTYVNKRSSKWLKYRFVSEQDIKVIEFEDNKDKSITAISKQGIRVKINNPYCEEVKKLIKDTGKAKITIEFMDKTEKDLVRFPIFKKIVEV